MAQPARTVPSPAGERLAENYLVTVQSLSPQPVEATEQNPPEFEDNTMSSLFSPYTTYAPVILFFALFISAFGILIIHRVRNWKATFTALVVAALAASIPLVLTTIEQGTRQQALAGPDEVPRRVRIVQRTTDSVTVFWETDAVQYGAVRVGPAPLSEPTSYVYVADMGNKVQSHVVTLPKLDHGIVYEAEVFSGTQWYANGEQLLRFTTNGK